MKKFLTLSLAALLVASPTLPVMANSHDMDWQATHTSYTYENNAPEIGLFLDLVNSMNINQSGGLFHSHPFVASTSQHLSNSANVWFQNNGSTAVSVTLVRNDGGPARHLMNLNPGQADFRTGPLIHGVSYSVQVSNASGAPIVGALRVRQLGINE